jgi:chemotaxis protein CheD
MTAIVPLVQSPATPNGARTVYLQAGQLTAVADPTIIVTILGSCVAICVWDIRLGVGGMNHYMLPFPTAKQNSSPRFGTVAWRQLLDKLAAFGVQKQNLRAGIFGGACIMEAFREDLDHIGARNVELAEKQLGEAGVMIVQREVGGRRGRKLTFETATGHITVKEL